jgi:hypothetical protein
MRPGTALVQAYLASRLSPTAPPAHPFPLSVPKRRAFVDREALRTANGRTDHRPKASGHDDPQSARRLPVSQELVIAFGPSSLFDVRGRRAICSACIAAGPCKRLCLFRAASPDGEFDSNAASMPALRPRSLAPIETADVERGNPYFAMSPSRSSMTA